MIILLLTLLSALITLYTLCCFINVLLSWIPGLKFTKFGHFISSICNPYMDFFSKYGWFRIASLDFSPIVSIGILSIISSILAGILGTGRIYFGGILSTIFSMIWGIFSSLMGILTIFVFIRWIVLIINNRKTTYSSGWEQIDSVLTKITYKVAGTFSKKGISYVQSLLVTWISFLVVLIAGNYLIDLITKYCEKIPF